MKFIMVTDDAKMVVVWEYEKFKVISVVDILPSIGLCLRELVNLLSVIIEIAQLQAKVPWKFHLCRFFTVVNLDRYTNYMFLIEKAGV